MEYFLLVFLHVTGAIVWAGGAITMGFFTIPAVLEAGPGGGAVMNGVMKRRFPVLMTGSAIVVIVTGLRLYTSRFSMEWLTSAEGIVLSLGGLLGIGAFVIGLFVQKPVAMKLGALGAQIAASGGPPAPEQARELAAIRSRLAKVGRVTAWHLFGAVLLMAVHRLATLF